MTTTLSADWPGRPELLRYDLGWLRRYEATTGHDAVVKAAEMRAFARLMRTRRGSTSSALDIGTCTGRYLMHALSAGARVVVGIDQSPDSVDFCRQSVDLVGATVLRADIRRSDTATRLIGRFGSFDLVTMMLGTINHFDPGELPDVMRNIGACLAPHGRVVVSTWRRTGVRFSLYSKLEREALETGLITRPRLDGIARASGLHLAARSGSAYHNLFLLERSS